ncbi:MAG TPA: SGNH/GDSL hydrolase family protein [Candidatus Limnocylindrales bacterium]|jgi:lysophospholipase L1-like esterase|nr:SGNH/GDSL hydrolase family protein [Candidatus Limnocylindrales bacterium]
MPARAGFRYVALGDSYTIGTSVAPAGRWPDQLVDRLAPSATPLRLVANLGVNGFTSQDVIDVELPRLAEIDAQFASLMVGVNDVVQGVPAEKFEANAARILDELLGRLPATRIVAVSTPDYTVMPEGGAYGDPDTQRAGVERNNAILAGLAVGRGVSFVDIFELSRRAATDRALVAEDGLHPSAEQYRLWVDAIAPVVEDLLTRS